MIFSDNEKIRYDKDIIRSHWMTIVVEDAEITVLSAHQFVGKVYHAVTGVEVCELLVTINAAAHRVTFELSSAQTQTFTSGDSYRYEIKYKSTAATDWEPYMWGYTIIYDTGVGL